MGGGRRGEDAFEEDIDDEDVAEGAFLGEAGFPAAAQQVAGAAGGGEVEAGQGPLSPNKLVEPVRATSSTTMSVVEESPEKTGPAGRPCVLAPATSAAMAAGPTMGAITMPLKKPLKLADGGQALGFTGFLRGMVIAPMVDPAAIAALVAGAKTHGRPAGPVFSGLSSTTDMVVELVARTGSTSLSGLTGPSPASISLPPAFPATCCAAAGNPASPRNAPFGNILTIDVVLKGIHPPAAASHGEGKSGRQARQRWRLPRLKHSRWSLGP
jgi:hypothetical protein